MAKRYRPKGDAGIGALTRVLFSAVLSFSICASAQASEDVQELIRHQFEIYDPAYGAHREQYGERLKAMSEAIAEAQANGRNLHCTQQMYLEAKWLYRYTAHWDRLADKLTRIEQSLDDPDQSFAAEQSPVDGMWGICYEEWFMRLAATVDGLENLAARGERPRYQLRSAGKFDTGKKLVTRMQGLLISDIAHTGVDNRGELSSLITSIAQGAFKPLLRDMLVKSADLRISSGLDSVTEAFRFFLSGAQDPTTGYWGAWYIVDGKIHKTSDLSMTYHVIAYTNGRVERWPQIIATTKAIEALPYPYGWRHNGKYNNHNLYDVAKIYKFAWPHMSKAEHLEIAKQIDSMIHWSLANTLGPDDQFLHDPTFSDSLTDEYYFGVSFLDVVGYWKQDRRFWTPSLVDKEGAALCCRLKHRMTELDLEGWAANGAMRKLERNCSQCPAPNAEE
ncbi:MAG TPA: hypothetical protein VF226_05245 [Hyphomicrobiaceae bacterium]